MLLQIFYKNMYIHTYILLLIRSKAALNMLFKVLSVEEEDITSIAIAPGIVDTSMQKIIREKGEKKTRLLFLYVIGRCQSL